MIHQATKDNTEVVDVDGSHLHKKGKHFENTGDLMASLDPHLPQSSDEEAVTEAYASDVAKNIPPVTSGVMYTHLSMHAGQQRDVQSSHLGMYTLGIRPH